MAKRRQSIFIRLLLWFIGVGLGTAFITGVVHFHNSKTEVLANLDKQGRSTLKAAVSLFDQSIAIPVLDMLELSRTMAGLDLILQSWGDEIYLVKPNVEKQFIRITRSRKKLFKSVAFFDSNGQELVAIQGVKRARSYRDLRKPARGNTYHRQVNIRSDHPVGQKVRDTGGKEMYKLVHGRYQKSEPDRGAASSARRPRCRAILPVLAAMGHDHQRGAH